MKYTEQAQNAISVAKKTAKDLKHPYVGTEHLLLGLFRTRTGVASQVMRENGVEDLRKVKKAFVEGDGNISFIFHDNE